VIKHQEEFLFLANDQLNRSTPFLLMRESIINTRIKEFEDYQSEQCEVYYAVKANSDIGVLSLIARSGLGFEIASEGELELLLNLGVSSQRIITSNPIKSSQFIEKLLQVGISRFVVDSYDELEKICSQKPDAEIVLRIIVDNSQSTWPLDEKYGVEVTEANIFLQKAKSLGLNPIGLTFHVGSQCVSDAAWKSALFAASNVWDQAASEGILLNYLNMGGGFPASHGDVIPNIKETFRSILSCLSDKFPSDIQIAVEPGRGLVADAGVLVASVIGKATRRDGEWVYLDVGVWNGLTESIGGIEYSFFTGNSDVSGKNITIAGPSCDSFDVVSKSVILNTPMTGDRIMIFPAGAYTSTYASNFNGMKIPEVIVV